MIYKVTKYFDDHFDGVALITEDKVKAHKKCDELNEKIRHSIYTKYRVREYKTRGE